MPRTELMGTVNVWAALIGILMFSIGSSDAIADELFRCKPLYPVFCHNIHVGCAGRTAVPARAFSVSRQGGKASVTFDDGSRWWADVEEANGDTILMRIGSQNWIRIEDNGRFSYRVYSDVNALMALGQCTN